MTKADKEGQRKAPILRFKGFTDDWEQRKLNDIAKVYDGIHETPNYTMCGIPFVSVENIKTLTTKKYVSKSFYEEKFKIKPQYDDILMTRIGDIGTSNVVSKIPLAYYVSLALIRLNTGQNAYFFKYFFDSEYAQKELWSRTLHIAFPKKINKNEIGKINIYTTCIKEENKIAQLFNKLNSLLTLYENKRKLLTVLSQGLSQYLFNFSKEKSAIQMSLSSITLSEAKGIAKENTLSSGNIEYLDTTRLNGGKVKLVSGKKDVDFQDIIVLWDGSNAGKIYYGFSGILGSTLKVFKLKDDINSEYVYYYLKFKQNLILHKFRTPNIPHVSKDFSQRFNLPIPDKEKQNLIANILHLNELQVNLTNKKIKKLKQIKNSLLQKIFL